MEPSDTASSISVYSDCDCYLCQYVRDSQEPEPYPFCTTARNPAIYYAQCRHGKKRDCNVCRRPNLFVRAFRWYTNEHGAPKEKGKPCQVPAESCKDQCQEECNNDRTSFCKDCHDEKVVCSDPPNMSAFATWLDTKYHQYLVENAAPDACRVLYTKKSVIESCNADQEEQMQSGPCGRKRFSRLKGCGQWRRKKQKCHEKERREREKNQPYNPSMEFIMQPKNLSRAVSDCCYATPTCSADRHVAKSRSATATVCLNRSGYDNAEFAKPPVEQTCPKCKDKTLNNYKDAACQYTVPTGQNAQTQYESKNNSSKQNIAPPSSPPASYSNNKNTKQTRQHVICQCRAKTTVSFNSKQKTDIEPNLDVNKAKQQQDKAQSPSPSKTKLQQDKAQSPSPSKTQQQQDKAQSPSPSKTQQQQVQNQNTYTEVLKPRPSCQQPCPSKTQQQQNQYQDTYSEAPKQCPNFQQLCPSFNSKQKKNMDVEANPNVNEAEKQQEKAQQPFPSNKTQHQQVQYQERYFEVQKLCPNLQQPCPGVGGPTLPELCPSLRDPHVSRRPCPSLRKVCPPCASYNPNISKITAPQSQQNAELKTNSLLQYQQSSQENNQTQQAKFDSHTQYPNIKPTLRDCCFANYQTKNVCCVQKQVPTFVEPELRVGTMPLKQEEYSLRAYAANVDFGPSEPGPSWREAGTRTNTYSVHAQGSTLLYAQHENSATCYCSNCHPSGMTYDKTACCRKNESVQQPESKQNVFIKMSTEEAKCSVNCPFYANISIKGQTTQTMSQNVQFSKSADQTVQTSDTAIRLDRGTILEYPLFMRVVCADKLQ